MEFDPSKLKLVVEKDYEPYGTIVFKAQVYYDGELVAEDSCVEWPDSE